MDASLISGNFFNSSRILPISRSSMVRNEKLFSRSTIKYRPFTGGPTWSDLFLLEQLKSHPRELPKSCSIHGKNHEISGPHNFGTPMKRNILNVCHWNCWNWSVCVSCVTLPYGKTLKCKTLISNLKRESI